MQNNVQLLYFQYLQEKNEYKVKALLMKKLYIYNLARVVMMLISSV